MRDFNSYNLEQMGLISHDTDTWLMSCLGLCNMDGTGIVYNNGFEAEPREHNSNFDRHGRLKIRTVKRTGTVKKEVKRRVKR